ncbi:MAG: hypothetical protein H6985_09875 [Pseudomonadales bacterium]|nr:hypothetical protein [Halioglobus sp.]MCP5129878.1 hypothetical protein [Pseudomonadales bacterium]
MNKDLEQALDSQDLSAESAPVTQPASSRRRFTRNALVGTAVLASLSNRPAWGGGGDHANDTCLSASLLASFVANDTNRGNALASFAGRDVTDEAMKILRTPEKHRHQHGTNICVQKR